MDDTHDRVPGYLGAMTAYGASIVTTVAVARSRDQALPDRFSGADLALRAVATHVVAGGSDALQHLYARLRTE